MVEPSTNIPIHHHADSAPLRLTGRREVPTESTPVMPCVLILESDEDNGEMYGVGLATAGFLPLVAADPVEARRHLRRRLPDAVVVGTNDMDGEPWNLIRELKADMRTRGVPVVVLTGRAGTAVPDVAGELGCAAVLLKPCLPVTLNRLLVALFASDSAAFSVSTGGDLE